MATITIATRLGREFTVFDNGRTLKEMLRDEMDARNLNGKDEVVGFYCNGNYIRVKEEY